MAVVPHLGGAPDELIAAGPLHAVDAQVRTTDADGVLRCPGPRRVVLRGNQPVPRIQGSGNRCPQVDVTEAKHQILCVVDDVVYLYHVVETVDAPDELDVPWAPRRIRPDAVHVALDGFVGRRVAPRQRQPYGAARHDELIGRGQLAVDTRQQVGHFGHRQHRGGELHLQGGDA